MLSLLAALLLPVTSHSANPPKGGLVLRDPTYYNVLPKGSKVLCKFMRDESFGVQLERGDGDEVKVTLITNGVNEGDKSSYQVTIKKNAHDSMVLRHQSRQGDIGTFREITILKRRSYEYRYELPGMLSSMSAIYSKDAEGKEKEDLYPDGSFRASCEAPLANR